MFINGKLLKLNQVKKLEDNYIISFGPNFATDFIYQFTTKDSSSFSKSDSTLISSIDLSSSSDKLAKTSSYFESTQPKTASLLVSASSNGSKLNTVRMNENDDQRSDEDQLRSNTKKIKILRARVKHLEDKMNGLKQKRRESMTKFKRISNKVKLLQHSNMKQKSLLRNAKSNLNRERTKKKELLKKLADQERLQQLQLKMKDAQPACSANAVSVSDETSSKIVQKYNELFTDDLICGVCLELYVEPVSATCGHSFCSFCLSQWLKRNLNRRFDCPLCRTSCKGYFKNVVIENIIEKYLCTANEEVLSTRARLIQEREKVVEASKNDPNNESNNRRVRRFNLNEFTGNALIEVLTDNRLQDLFNPFSDDASSNEDDLNDEDDIDFYNEDFDEDFDSEDEQDEFEQFDVVLND